jgi:propanol-preferring alcohol dehydrogenase
MSQNEFMRAMILDQPGQLLALRDCPMPEPYGRQARLRVLACAVCRTDLHVVDDDLPNPKPPLILGHEIVGRVTRRDILFARRNRLVPLPV